MVAVPVFVMVVVSAAVAVDDVVWLCIGMKPDAVVLVVRVCVEIAEEVDTV